MIKKLPLLFIFILSLILLSGCGTKETEDAIPTITPTAAPEPTVTVTPTPTITPTSTSTPEPIATPTPELSPLEKKYQYYDSSAALDDLITGTLEELENALSTSCYYSTWYNRENENTLEINAYTRDGKEYSVKSITSSYGIITVKFYNLDDPDTIYTDSCYPDDEGIGFYMLYNDDNAYTNMTQERIDEIYNQINEISDDGYIPYTVGDVISVYAVELAKEKISNEIDMSSATDFLSGSFEYDNDDDWYFEFDGDRTYYIGFNISYNRLNGYYPYYMECVYVDKDRDHHLKLRNYDLTPQY